MRDYYLGRNWENGFTKLQRKKPEKRRLWNGGNMKKKISLLLTGILTLGLLTGCGGSGAESGTAAADVGTDAAQSTEAAVSYTHLTLPTIEP